MSNFKDLVGMSNRWPWPEHSRNLKGKVLTSEEKFWLGRRYSGDKKSRKLLMNTTQLAKSTLQHYQNAYEKEIVLSSGPGRPKLFDEGDYVKIREIVSHRKNRKGTLIQPAELRRRMTTIAKKTAERHGKAKSSVEFISERTYRRVLEEVGATEANGEKTTDARAAACSDIRNTVSNMAMNLTIIPQCEPDLILNSDATQFRVGYDCNKKVKVVFIKEEQGDSAKKAAADKTDKGITAYFIKFYLLINAAGCQSDPVFVIADSTMPEDVIHPMQVRGLSIGTQIDGKGWLVFCKTRGANEAFYMWFNRVILFKLLHQSPIEP